VLAQELLAKRHSIDAGVMQINSSNWARFGLRPKTIFDLQANVCARVSIIAEDYAAERRVSCRYNTGKPDCTSSPNAGRNVRTAAHRDHPQVRDGLSGGMPAPAAAFESFAAGCAGYESSTLPKDIVGSRRYIASGERHFVDPKLS
jgi:hypothetical protein